MPITINGTTGIAGVDGSAGTPSLQGTDNNTGTFFPAADTVAWATGGSERARITSGGNLLVGTTTDLGAGFPLQVDGGGSNILKIGGSNGTKGIGLYGSSNVKYGAIDLNVQTGELQIASGQSGQNAYFITFKTNDGTERARITSTGNLLVGTTSGVEHILRRSPTDGSNAIKLQNANPSGGTYVTAVEITAQSPNNATSYFIYCADSTAERATIRSNGGLANYSANNVNLSDQRLKTDVQPAGTYLDKICAIPVKTFLYKDQTDTERNLGVMAQDVDAVAPELVDHSGFGKTPEGESPYLAVYQTDLQYALMKCIQELKAQNDELRQRVAALEGASN